MVRSFGSKLKYCNLLKHSLTLELLAEAMDPVLDKICHFLTTRRPPTTEELWFEAEFGSERTPGMKDAQTLFGHFEQGIDAAKDAAVFAQTCRTMRGRMDAYMQKLHTFSAVRIDEATTIERIMMQGRPDGKRKFKELEMDLFGRPAKMKMLAM